MGSLVAGTALGLLLASPQLLLTAWYWPRTTRRTHTWQDKAALGSIPLKDLLLNTLWGRRTQDTGGLLFPESRSGCGVCALVLACCAPWSWWSGVWLLACGLALGKHAPLFRLTSRLHLRLPARYTYWMALSLGMLSLSGFQRMSPPWQLIALSLQTWELVMMARWLWPMELAVQRWERPSKAITSPLGAFIQHHPNRYSGLPFPLTTGQLTRTLTLGYNGGSQLAGMAAFRNDPDPMGSGGHDWFALNEDGPLLDAYGVRYAYTYRRLTGKWVPTAIPHLYENVAARSRPTPPLEIHSVP